MDHSRFTVQLAGVTASFMFEEQEKNLGKAAWDALTALSGEALETKLKDPYKLPGPYIQYLKKSGQLTDKSAFDNKYNGMLRSYITKTAAREDHDKKKKSAT